MITASIDDHELEAAIGALKGCDDRLAKAFAVAGHQTIDVVAKDLAGGVSSVSGDLRSAIGGGITQAAWPEIEGQVTGGSVHRGYDYGARLDKDGRMTWRSGKYEGKKTWGWFSYAGKRVARTMTRKYFRQALELVVVDLITEMRAAGVGEGSEAP